MALATGSPGVRSCEGVTGTEERGADMGSAPPTGIGHRDRKARRDAWRAEWDEGKPRTGDRIVKRRAWRDTWRRTHG